MMYSKALQAITADVADAAQDLRTTGEEVALAARAGTAAFMLISVVAVSALVIALAALAKR